MRRVIPPAIGTKPAVTLDQPIQLFDHTSFDRARTETHRDVVEGAVHVESLGDRALGHPDRPETPFVRQ